MDRIEQSPDIEELLGVLDQLTRLLRTWGEDAWVERIDRDRRLVAEGHPDAFAHLLGAFGGPTSLMGLSISPANGHDIEEDRVRPVNDRLRVLRAAVVTKASALRGDTLPHT